MNLEIRNLSMSYGKAQALSDVTLTLRSGGLIGLVGPNGAGKSTLLKILATLLRPSRGQVLLDGTDILRKPDAMRRLLGYLPQDVPVYGSLSAWEFLAFMASVKKLKPSRARKQIASLMKTLHLSDVGKKPLSGFSGGMRQRVGIASALLGDPKVIIADEPTTGLDPRERVTLRSLLSGLASSRIVLLSTHIVSDVEAVASDLVVLKKGRVLFHGVPEALTARASGHVWEYTVPDFSQIPAGSSVSSAVQETEGIRVKTVGDRPTASDTSAASPTLEDACLYVMGGGSF
jgi:ABC-type multidrug transport system ATPase subunit